MIGIENFKRAIHWLQTGILELESDSDRKILHDGVLHSFRVTYNVTESILRHAFGELADDPDAAFLSTPELMRYARDEGYALVSAEAWLRYGLAIENAMQTLGDSFETDVLPLLPAYIHELQAFAERLEGKLALVG